jgi:outer membrane protein OmpA-like peptidoglycan-associated protein
MNGRKAKPVILLLACALVLALVGGIGAQSKDLVDLTGRENLSPEDIVRGLVRPKTRGITPVTQTVPAVAITVHFAFDSSAILPEAAQNLRSVGIALQSSELASARIRIEGHTDSIGSDQYNLRLSERRAGSVRQYLVRQYRIAPERLIAIGKGEAESIADNDTTEGRQKNRRVELVNLGTN